ncbi:MAG: hypothetical protein J0G32_03665 [Alphaproteobacteria bacterium]|nr:hypothetical protein [Alphaproteobacteria bacterium]OJV16053.1 MAG: hypothetical protein BGO27_04320 [Alphaproteobacteria bacterium 33-17]
MEEKTLKFPFGYDEKGIRYEPYKLDPESNKYIAHQHIPSGEKCNLKFLGIPLSYTKSTKKRPYFRSIQNKTIINDQEINLVSLNNESYEHLALKIHFIKTKKIPIPDINRRVFKSDKITEICKKFYIRDNQVFSQDSAYTKGYSLETFVSNKYYFYKSGEYYIDIFQNKKYFRDGEIKSEVSGSTLCKFKDVIQSLEDEDIKQLSKFRFDLVIFNKNGKPRVIVELIYSNTMDKDKFRILKLLSISVVQLEIKHSKIIIEKDGINSAMSKFHISWVNNPIFDQEHLQSLKTFQEELNKNKILVTDITPTFYTPIKHISQIENPILTKALETQKQTNDLTTNTINIHEIIPNQVINKSQQNIIGYQLNKILYIVCFICLFILLVCIIRIK